MVLICQVVIGIATYLIALMIEKMSGCLLSLGGEFYILRTRREEVEMNLDAEKRDGYYISMDMKKFGMYS